MADPTKYVPGYSYSGWQASNPSRPLPADEVDNDFANIQRTTNELVDAVKDVRRSDGKLKNQSVGPDQLSPALTIGFTFAGTWLDGRSYGAGDGVVKDDTFYSARIAHTADVSNAPGNAAYWNELFSLKDIVVTGGMSLPHDSFVGDGVTKDFTLSFTALSKFNLFVQVGGVVQGTDAYAANGNLLSFINPPPNGYGIEVRGFATVSSLVVPEDGSVSTAKLADLSVTEAKLAAAVAAKLNDAMPKSIYDPASIGGDVFDQANHESFTTAAVATKTIPEAVAFLRTNGAATVGDNRGADFKGVGSEPAHAGKVQSANGRWFEDTTYASFTVNIPSDFATVQAAIDALSRVKMRHKARIIVKLATGTAWATLQLENGDFSQFVIQCVDAEVPVPSGFNGNIIRGINAQMPTLDCLINGANQATGEGIWLSGMSTMVINPGKGVKNCWGTGLLAYLGPRVAAQGSVFTGNARNNITGAGMTAWGAYVDASDGDVSNAGYYGAQAAHGGILTFERGKANDVYRYGIRGSDAGIIDFSEGEAHRAGVYGIYAFQNSHINAPGAMATQCGTANATCVNASTLNVRQADLRNSLGHGLLTSSGKVDAFEAQFDGAVGDGINASGSEVFAGAATATGCTGRGFYATQGATISASLGVANNCSSGFYAERQGVIEAEGGSATGCAFDGAAADKMGEINVRAATLTGNSRSGVRATEGGKINATNAQCRKVVGSDDVGTSTADIQAFTGANIIAHGAVGGANRATNTILTAGIIYR